MPEIVRLHEQLVAAGIPIVGVSATSPIRVDYAAEATEQQRQQGDALAAGFNQHDAVAEAAWRIGKLRAAMQPLVDAGGDVTMIDRAIALVVLDELNDFRGKVLADLNAIRAAMGLGAAMPALNANRYPQRTPVQLRNAIKQKISDGDAD